MSRGHAPHVPFRRHSARLFANQKANVKNFKFVPSLQELLSQGIDDKLETEVRIEACKNFYSLRIICANSDGLRTICAISRHVAR